MTTDMLPDPGERSQQAAAILDALAAWLAAAPGRRVTLDRAPDGAWRTTLHEDRPTGGASLADSLAQVAQVARLEVEP